MRYIFCWLCLWSSLALAEGERLALIIGNADYPDAPLNNALNDARDIAQALESVHFRVLLKENVDRLTLLKALREFGTQLKPDSVGVLYYSGHALQYQGRNYLLPAQTSLPDAASLDLLAVPAHRILEETSIAGNLSNILIFDACRNNAFMRNASDDAQGLAKMEAPPGTLIAYATAPGKIAQDASGHRNSPYTKHLLNWITKPNLSVGQMFTRVRDAVIRETQNQQIPSEVSFLREDFYFGGVIDEKTLAKQETERLLGELREVEDAKRTESKQQMLRQRLQQCQNYEKNLYLVEAPTDMPDAAALPCYQKLLQEYPEHPLIQQEIEQRLGSLERRYRAWAEGSLRQGQWQKAQNYLQGLEKINPTAKDLPQIKQELQNLKQQNQQNQQLKGLTEELLDSHLSTDLGLNLPQHYWPTDTLQLTLVAGQAFIYYLPMPTQPSLSIENNIDIKLTTAKPEWLEFIPQQRKLSGIAPLNPSTEKQEWIFLSHAQAQADDLLTVRLQFIEQQPKTVDVAVQQTTHSSVLERNSLAFFEEIVVRCFAQMNYHVLLHPMQPTQALQAMQTHRVQAAYPYSLNNQAFYASAPLSKQILWQQSLAHLLVSKTETQQLDLLYGFNHQLRRLQQSGQLYLMWTRYEALAKG